MYAIRSYYDPLLAPQKTTDAGGTSLLQSLKFPGTVFGRLADAITGADPAILKNPFNIRYFRIDRSKLEALPGRNNFV